MSAVWFDVGIQLDHYESNLRIHTSTASFHHWATHSSRLALTVHKSNRPLCDMLILLHIYLLWLAGCLHGESEPRVHAPKPGVDKAGTIEGHSLMD